jgi:CRP/FNR family transcriptional regulator, cyclic AMP receptor protein
MRTLDQVVLESSVFSGMDDLYAEQLAGCSQTVGFEAGETLFREGEPADVFYVLRRGRVALELYVPGRGPLTIETIEAGSVVGWSWLFAPHVWHFDARAVAPVRAVAVDGACIRGKCDQDPALGYELMQRFSAVLLERLNTTRLRLADLYGGSGGR